MSVDWESLRETSLADILAALSVVGITPDVRRGERAWHLDAGGLRLRISDVQLDEPRTVQHAVAAMEAMRTQGMTQEVQS